MKTKTSITTANNSNSKNQQQQKQQDQNKTKKKMTYSEPVYEIKAKDMKNQGQRKTTKKAANNNKNQQQQKQQDQNKTKKNNKPVYEKKAKKLSLWVGIGVVSLCILLIIGIFSSKNNRTPKLDYKIPQINSNNKQQLNTNATWDDVNNKFLLLERKRSKTIEILIQKEKTLSTNQTLQ